MIGSQTNHVCKLSFGLTKFNITPGKDEAHVLATLPYYQRRHAAWIRRSMKSGSLAVVVSFCVAFAAAANAQLAGSDSPSEGGSRPAGPARTPGTTEEAPAADHSTAAGNSSSICQMVGSAAAANGLPFEFFAQIIWQESRFRSDIVGPLTRTGQRAQGIAQFMPMTAAERLLHDPFDPVQALRNRPSSCASSEPNSATSA
jgi:soluble lytic murein transglycosylase-like protein